MRNGSDWMLHACPRVQDQARQIHLLLCASGVVPFASFHPLSQLMLKVGATEAEGRRGR